MGVFYEDQLHIKLSWWERRSLFSGWHFLNFFSDILIVIGTVNKIALNYNVSSYYGAKLQWVLTALVEHVKVSDSVTFLLAYTGTRSIAPR